MKNNSSGKNIFKHLFDVSDIFRLPVTLFLNGSVKISTFIGKFITVLIIGFLVYFLWNSDLLQKTHPQILSKEVKLDRRPIIFLNNDNFTLVVGLADSNNDFMVDPTMFTFNLVYHQEINSEIISQEYPLTLCEQKNVDNNRFFNIPIKGTYCLPNEIYKLEGYWDEDSINYLYIELIKCVNSTSNNNSCKSNDDINSFLQDYYLDIYIENPNVDYSNYENPFKREISIFYQKISFQLFKSIEFYLKPVIIYTDEGLFSETIESKNNLVVGDYMNDIGFSDIDSIYLATISIYSSNQCNQISRKYQKIQDVLAQFGGICNVLIIIGFFLSKIENQFNFGFIVMNEIYNFRYLKGNTKNISKKLNTSFSQQKKNICHELKLENLVIDKNCGRRKIPSLTKLSENSSNVSSSQEINDKGGVKIKPKFKSKFSLLFVNNKKNSLDLKKNENNENNEKKNKKKLEKYKSIKVNKKKLKFGFFNYLKLVIKNRKYKLSDTEQLYMKGEKKIFEEFDIINIIRKLQDIEKLKNILLNEKQLYFFDLLSKPTISLTNPVVNQSKQELLEMSLRDSESPTLNLQKQRKTFQKFSDLYNELKSNSTKSYVDKKIIEMLDDDIVYVLDQQI